MFILETGRALSSRRRHRLHVRTEPPVYTFNATHWHGLALRRPDGTWAPPRDFAPDEYERMMGFPVGWTDLGPGTSRWDRLRALGNAVQPPLIEEVGRYLREEFCRS